jgi:hypothetical protein
VLRAFALGAHVPGAESQVRAREALQQLGRVGAEAETHQDLVAHDRRGGCRTSQHEPRAELGDEAADLQVVGPEVVAPLADAVRLVHGHERRREVRDQRAEAGVGEPLGGDVGQLESPRAQPRETLAHLVGGERRGEKRRRHAARLERPDLVVHQRDER